MGYAQSITRQKSRLRVLVAESPAIRRLLARAFAQAGFAVVECEPAQARQRLEEGPFALLVTNWASHVCDERIGMPIIYLSSEPADIPDRMPPRARVVQKPFDVQGLLGCARQLLISNPAGLRKPVQTEAPSGANTRRGANG
jgi:DNA-binding response OmpR family regulator